jgi:hypothetical protein
MFALYAVSVLRGQMIYHFFLECFAGRSYLPDALYALPRGYKLLIFRQLKQTADRFPHPILRIAFRKVTQHLCGYRPLV